ncbi:MAG TPA: hypothetical protein VH107_00980 [Lacipirellulaceae bacterium]|nr:hypothetical protein [Lacipirellulaceae bacterium]
MRHFARVLIVVALSACCSQTAVAADSSSSSSWWPWSSSSEKKPESSPLGASGTNQLGTPQLGGPVSRPLAGPAQKPLGSPATSPLGDPVPKPKEQAKTTDHWMLSSPSGKVSWPHLTMPKLPSISNSTADTKKPAPKSSWVEKTPTPPKPSPMQSVTNEAHKMSNATKDAWHKTVKAVTPSSSTSAKSDNSPRVAKKEMDPPWYKRMFGAKTELEQPQTVPQWMAQKRLDP